MQAWGYLSKTGNAVQNSNCEMQDRDLQIVTSTLYHPDLQLIAENTLLSGDARPSSLYMLKYHQERMLAAISDLPTAPQVMHDAIADAKGLDRLRELAAATVTTGPSKIRFALDCHGELTCTALFLSAGVLLRESAFFPARLSCPDSVPESDIKWMIGVSQNEIRPDFITKHKTNLRSQYAKVMEDAPYVDPTIHKAEMLCVNIEQQVMEGCITTPYFWKNGTWITPRAECGGNLGTTRRWALEKGLAVKGIVMKEDLTIGQIIVVSNGVWGFGFGRIIAV